MTARHRNTYNDHVDKMGNQLKLLREINKLTIEDLAEQLDVSPRMIYNYESGKNILSIDMIVRIYTTHVFRNRSLEELVDIFIVEIYK